MPRALPTLTTPRLVLRPFAPTDAGDVQRLAGDRRVAATTALIPHPYEDGMAESWIATHAEQYAGGRGATFAVTQRPGGELVGAIGLTRTPGSHQAELGYWIGVPHWGRGYATEAVRAVLRFGFEVQGLHRIYAHYQRGNEASGRVMEKAGLRLEGCLRHGCVKWGEYRDLVVHGILATDPRPDAN